MLRKVVTSLLAVLGLGLLLASCDTTGGDPGTIVAPVAISPEDGSAFLSNATITLSTSTEGASIFYTTDGTEPSDSSTAYTGPFSVGAGTITVKAIATKEGMAPSVVSTAIYTVTQYIDTADGTKAWTFPAADTWVPTNIDDNSYEEVLTASDITFTLAKEYTAQPDAETDRVLHMAVNWPATPTANTDYKVEAGMPGYDTAVDLSDANATISARIYIPSNYKNDGSLNFRFFYKDTDYDSVYGETIQVYRLPAGGWYTIYWKPGLDPATADGTYEIYDNSGAQVDTTGWFADGWNSAYIGGTPVASAIKMIGIAFSAKDFNAGSSTIGLSDAILFDWLDNANSDATP